jgi:hypothetical protein
MAGMFVQRFAVVDSRTTRACDLLPSTLFCAAASISSGSFCNNQIACRAVLTGGQRNVESAAAAEPLTSRLSGWP